MNDNLTTICMVEFLYEAPPQIDKDALLSELRERCGSVDKLGDKGKTYLYAFPQHIIHYEDGDIPAQIALLVPDKVTENLDLEEALQQSWRWRNARQVVATCRVPLLLTEMMSRRLERSTRLNLFHNAVESVLKIVPSKAIYWSASQQIVDPATYLEARQSDDLHPLHFALNVRFYNISNGKRGEMLMDTMGLSVFGLPDLQCHFFNLDPNEVARVLFNAACYIFDNGDVIQDGHTIQGVGPSDKWKCHHEMALIKPEREVIDLDPGKPYRAGER